MAPLNKRLLQPGERIRVLVVDDSVVIRRLVTHALEQDPVIEVVGAASNGAIALQLAVYIYMRMMKPKRLISPE